MGTVLVRWKTRGALVEAGEAYRRDAGEEDEMPEAEARTLAASGVLEIFYADVPEVAEVPDAEDER